ncbi:MAG TPA: hypothetical protein VNK24_03550 [Elusimicrobiota bacterium]|nr:hypothetical protein [Elusimicrobiota bacterium]
MHKRRGADSIKIFLKAGEGKNCGLFFNTNPVFLAPELVDPMA